jgi:hypothetical protein
LLKLFPSANSSIASLRRGDEAQAQPVCRLEFGAIHPSASEEKRALQIEAGSAAQSHLQPAKNVSAIAWIEGDSGQVTVDGPSLAGSRIEFDLKKRLVW